MAKLDGIGIAAAGVGGLFVYSGVKGYSVPHAVQALVSGQAPSTGGVANPIGTPSGGSPSPGSLTNPAQVAGTGGVSSSAVANQFLTYAGKVPYVWGGANPRGWDCSGSCNYVLCHDGGLDIPGYAGGTFDGSSHGPSTYTWLPWALSGKLTKISEADVQAGSIVLWQSHMGVCLGNGSYVSAYDTQDGTAVKPIHGGGPWGEVATFWDYGSPAQNIGGAGPH